MARKCERPSCNERGEVAYMIDTANLIVNIDAPIPRDSSRVNILCRRHADALVVPRDWIIFDNRTKKQRLFSAPAAPRAQKAKQPRREKKKPMAVVQDLFEFATRVTTPPPEPVVEEVVEEIEDGDLQETQAMPWTPQFDRTGDLDGRLRAKGRLLSRAFGFDDVDLDHDQQHPEY
ncbi:MAG: hypothetical protein ACKPAF_02575 [Actinomycetota bacterium]